MECGPGEYGPSDAIVVLENLEKPFNNLLQFIALTPKKVGKCNSTVSFQRDCPYLSLELS